MCDWASIEKYITVWISYIPFNVLSSLAYRGLCTLIADFNREKKILLGWLPVQCEPKSCTADWLLETLVDINRCAADLVSLDGVLVKWATYFWWVSLCTWGIISMNFKVIPANLSFLKPAEGFLCVEAKDMGSSYLLHYQIFIENVF